MEVRDRIVVVTGGSAGIGRAMCERFRREGARAVVVAGRDGERVDAVARAIDGHGMVCDVTREEDVAGLVERVEQEIGPIGLFCSNAGGAQFGGATAHVAALPNEAWEQAWAVNLMAHVYAARALLPRMIARGGGYLLNTVSAAGVLNHIGNASYAASKHAAIGFAENLAFTHRDDGVRISVVCPLAVATDMLKTDGPWHDSDGVISPEDVADAVVQGLRDESFLILPHPEVATYMRRKVESYDKWIAGMAKLRRAALARAPAQPPLGYNSKRV